MSSSPAVEEAPWRAGLRSARAHLLPGVVLQILALLLVLAYYHHEPTQRALQRLASWRVETGFIFAVISTGTFGGLLPFLYLRSSPATRSTFDWPQGMAITAFWCYKGFEVDLFYRLLARIIGEGHDVTTIATKMVIDQFVYCPILAVPLTVIVYRWTELHFDTAKTFREIRAGRWYARSVFPVLISNLGVWIPAVCIIYALPTPLQLPLQNLVLCFFTLLIAHQTQRTV